MANNCDVGWAARASDSASSSSSSFPPSSSADAGSSSSSRRLAFKEGDWVEIFGLQSESGQELNGQEGFISRYVDEKGRFEVLVEAGERCVSVKAANLRRKRQAASTGVGRGAAAAAASGSAGGSAADRFRRGAATEPTKNGGAVGSSNGGSSGGSSAAARAMAKVAAAAAAAEDARWSPGDPARLVGLLKPPEEEKDKSDSSKEDADDKDLHTLNSSLCRLVAPVGGGRWLVEVQSKPHRVKTQNLRVCTRAEDRRRAISSWSLPWRVLLAGGIFATMMILLETEIAVQRVASLREAAQEEEPEDDEDSWTVRWPPSTTPGKRVAILAAVAPWCSFLWIVGTVAGCYKLHSSLKDPQVRFPQISELGVGTTSAAVLYRIGFAASAALLAALLLLHQELVLPHLPGGRHGQKGADFTWYGLAAAGGVAVQGVFLLEPGLSKQSIVHLAGAMLFFYGAWCHMGAARRLYMPGADIPPKGDEELEALAQAAAASKLLQHEFVTWLVEVRHSVLMRGPMAVFVVPVLSQLVERAPVESTPSGANSPSMRSALGLAQWLVVLNFALIFVSYGPELSVAAMLPMPSESEDA